MEIHQLFDQKCANTLREYNQSCSYRPYVEIISHLYNIICTVL
jgi:hypothetical protein